MSSSIPSHACRPARHLVPVPLSSRIGYRMIPPRNPSHEIPDTTTSRSSPRPISSPYCFPPNRVARRVESKPDAILPAIRSMPASLAYLLAPSHRLIRFARCLLASPNARCRHSPSAPCGSSISFDPPHLIGSSPVPLRFPLYFPPSVPPRLVPSDCLPCVQLRLAPSHRFIFRLVACPSSSISSISSISSVHRTSSRHIG